MDNPYIVRTLALASGERLPVLMDARQGEPLFAPTIYSLTQLRGRNLAANTIEQCLRHIMVFLLFLDQRGVDIESRLRDGRILDLAEIESLANTCKLHVADMVAAPSAVSSKLARIISIERYRKPPSTIGLNAVVGNSAASRIRGIADYLSWLAKTQLLKFPASSPEFLALEATRQLVIGMLKARIPESGSRNTLNARMGLAPEIGARLLAVTAKNSSENPWSGEFTRCRNELIFRWLYSFGLRRGELLNVKVSDIDFRKETVTIVRRADAPEDPRRKQPVVKTRDRVLPIPPDLCRLTLEYVLTARRQWVGARQHEYLIVADKTGAPMSLSALNKCFAFLRTRISDLPDDLSPHVLRHTWNDNFSAVMDRNKTADSDEQKMRSFLMGWSETSGTAIKYTRRHVCQKANQASLLMQSKMTQEDVS